ncbi:leucine--tRNA ligase [bacterium]|nr:leucine--tRNA ligase [bacterium]
MSYDFKGIEQKWQQCWKEDPYFKSDIEDDSKKKFYCLDMFPYPSGSGLHVGHWKGYVFSDLYARMKLLEGYDVLHPMGWDAFGLPAENDAIKKGIQPKDGTESNIKTFKKQLARIGAIYDWSKEVNTTDPHYYKWTQWIFVQMYKAGLAYESNMPINWCPRCLTGLANEEASSGECERCGTPVERKNIRQWVLKITEYADRLLEGLDDLDWPDRVKSMQRNWIGKSYGVRVEFKCGNVSLPVFTTRADTLFGATFMVVAPDHDLVDKIMVNDCREAVEAYRSEVAHMSEMDRTAGTREKTGVFTGGYAINPVNGESIPIYISAYVLKDYGTGVIMAVPAHDERDFEFAKKFHIPIRQVVKPRGDEDCYNIDGSLRSSVDNPGILINSGKFDGLDSAGDGLEQITAWLEKKGCAKREVCYRLRDWLFSRQRYWGEPIPLVHCDKCGVVPVPEKELPIALPEVENYKPTGTGDSPLADIASWVNTKCPKCGGAGKRETNTMPQWAGSCWYFLRYVNPSLDDKPFDSKDLDRWMPVDFYVGGIEHAVLHLLYARFYVKFLHDQGHLSFDEPFKKLFNQGMVCMKSPKSGKVEKMSKSKGNTVCPDEIVDQYGSDTLRVYMLFMGPPELDNEWQSDSIRGVHSFLKRLWAYAKAPKFLLPEGKEADEATRRRFHRFLKDYQTRLGSYRVNTAVASVMEFLNDAIAGKLVLDRIILRDLLVAFSLMAPHFCSELLESILGIHLKNCSMPHYDEALADVKLVEVVIQVNGKLRGTLSVDRGTGKDEILESAREIVKKWLGGSEIKRIVFVPDRLLNFVI